MARAERRTIVNLTIDSDRLSAEIDALAQISEAEPPVVTRIVFTPADMRARKWMIEYVRTDTTTENTTIAMTVANQ